MINRSKSLKEVNSVDSLDFSNLELGTPSKNLVIIPLATLQATTSPFSSIKSSSNSLANFSCSSKEVFSN